MGTTKKLKLQTMISLILLTCLCVQSSCSDDTETSVDQIAVVETLVEDFKASDGLSVDSDGTIYASNYGAFLGTEVLKVDPNSASVEVAISNLKAPTGNVVDDDGNIFVVNNVRRLSPDSNELQGDVLKVSKDGTRSVMGTLPGFPSGIALDSEGNLYVTNYSFPGVHKITSEKELTVYIQDQGLLGGVGIDFDNNGNLFVGNFITGDILKIDADKSIEILATIPTVQQNVVVGYITFLDGYIFATAPGEHLIYRVSMSGEINPFAGSGIQETVDGPLLEASFNTPNGITADPIRKVLYVTEGGESGGALRVLKLK